MKRFFATLTLAAFILSPICVWAADTVYGPALQQVKFRERGDSRWYRISWTFNSTSATNTITGDGINGLAGNIRYVELDMNASTPPDNNFDMDLFRNDIYGSEVKVFTLSDFAIPSGTDSTRTPLDEDGDRIAMQPENIYYPTLYNVNAADTAEVTVKIIIEAPPER